ncbi:uncharacterized protein DUF4296 [Dyadobacter jejuensis]|uniref:Uncharacterized protein DUF4296 n=1 Tax=Dyadobacter jejuensis TaxID=1082580 RepID=A0A316AEG1_9BACT|nr:DUF4296 domain-containing protein [Dyadobacter jejuensis]PWJ55274.1 uncharacterized protein DUF4296 [Dyadobacter jejuensis]
MRVTNRTHQNFTRILALILACGVWLAACTNEDQVPSGTLSKEKMAGILADIHLAEARITKLQLKTVDSSAMVYEKLKLDIWKRHQVDTLQYRTSYEFYVTHPKLMKEVYEQVKKNLERREKEKNIKI